ncbi:MAG TPA: hypothetical protein VE226_06805 [Nitrososphaeraceae archaeon]|nr:hypothetical protein [Nitrososphaeraceae archaeon]
MQAKMKWGYKSATWKQEEITERKRIQSLNQVFLQNPKGENNGLLSE